MRAVFITEMVILFKDVIAIIIMIMIMIIIIIIIIIAITIIIIIMIMIIIIISIIIIYKIFLCLFSLFQVVIRNCSMEGFYNR